MDKLMKNLFFTVATTLSIVSVSYLLPSIFPGERAKILSDVGSEIRLVACSATNARTSSLRNAELVSNIVNGLPQDVHIMLLVNDRSAFATSSNNRRVTFVEMPRKSDISIWPQDPFVVVQGPSTTKLTTPCSFNREDDERMPAQLAGMLNLEVIHSEMHFEGGTLFAEKTLCSSAMTQSSTTPLFWKRHRSRSSSGSQNYSDVRLLLSGNPSRRSVTSISS